MHRREFVLGSLTTLTLMRAAAAQSQPALSPDIEIAGSLPPLPTDLTNNASDPAAPYTATELTGTAPPTQDEIIKAYELLIQAPYGGRAIDVAQYFLAVGAGAYGQVYRPFAREWPVRANPLIFHFFSATQTKPDGDETAWCAAFLNWCLLRARAKSADEIGKAPGFFSKTGKSFPEENLAKYSTNSASSGSFRCWNNIDQPDHGDIVVFKNAQTDSLSPVCRGTGHVAFFIGVPRPGLVRVLGGNQSQPGSGGAITVANMTTTPGSRFMKYVSASR